MKKFLFGALLAVTTMFMASCAAGGGSSAYTKGGEEPKIDAQAGTVNGKTYDNKTEACWEITMTGKASYGGFSASYDETMYMWGTEFYVVAAMEQSMWSIAQSGEYTSASYTYKKNSAKNEDACEAQNEDEDDDLF